MTAGRVELHTHLEGALAPARLIALAERHGRPGVPAACLDADRNYVFADFHDFLRLFKDATTLLRTPDDYREVALDLGAQLAADGVAYAEVTVSYGVMLAREIRPRAVQAALADAAAEIAGTRGVVLRWIPDAVRQWGLDRARRAWEEAGAAGRALGVVGFGLGGDETSGPAADFAGLFAEVQAEGLGVTIHAGEVPTMGADALQSVRAAVEICGADRLGHGTAAAGDPHLLGLLVARGVHVEACPSSNVLTGAVENLADHPLPDLLAAGVSCSLNTDDRAFFGLDLRREEEAVIAACGLTAADLDTMQAAARAAAFDPAAAPAD